MAKSKDINHKRQRPLKTDTLKRSIAQYSPKPKPKPHRTPSRGADPGIADFQNANCAKGCRFAQETNVGSGLPCCDFSGGLISDGDTCYTRATPGADPEFTCQVCKRKQRYSNITGNSYAQNDLYGMRVCSYECARTLISE